MSLTYSYAGFVVQTIYLLELFPQMRCKYQDGEWLEECDFQEMCVDGEIGDGWTMEILDAPDSLNNWAVQMPMWCYSSTVIGMFGSCVILGMVIAGVVMKILTDTVG